MGRPTRHARTGYRRSCTPRRGRVHRTGNVNCGGVYRRPSAVGGPLLFSLLSTVFLQFYVSLGLVPRLFRACRRLRVPRPLPCVLLNLLLEATVPVCSIAGEVRPGRGQSRYRGAHPPRHHSAPHPRQPAASARRWLNEGPPLTSCGWVHKGIGRGYSSRLLSARFNVGAPLRAAVRRTKMFCVADAIISPLRGRRNASPHSSSPIRLPPFFL